MDIKYKKPAMPELGFFCHLGFYYYIHINLN